MSRPTKESFLADVKSHSMEIRQDDGVFRHVRFSKNGSSVHAFQLTTTPYHLIVTGDMGAYVFSRLNDMFEFFRSDDLSVNLSYWQEKLESIDRDGGVAEFSEEKLKAYLTEMLEESDDYQELAKEEKQEVMDEIASICEMDEQDAYDALSDFDLHDITFEDCWDWFGSMKTFTYQYIWICYAISWGVNQYDQSKVVSGGAA